MRRKLFLTIFALATSLVGAVSGVGLGRAGVSPTCGGVQVASFLATSAAAQGRGLSVVVGDSISSVDGGSRTTIAAPVADGVIRQVTSRDGFGTAYVDDVKGPDTIVVLSPSGVVRLPQPAEAMHPSFSPGGDLVWSLGSTLRLRSATSGDETRIPAPPGASMLFSPTFVGARRLVAIASEPVVGATTEDEALNDLWRYDLRARAWTRLTRFHAGADRWTAIRTPVAASDGALEFVLVRDRASSTEEPSYELWSLDRGTATRVRTLSGEMYLAGFQAGHRIWNVYDAAVGDWRLLMEESDGAFTDIGCGSAIVDPLSRPDPDKEGTSGLAPDRSDDPALGQADGRVVGDGVAPLGVLVGDFSSRVAARGAAQAIAAAYGAAASVEVVDNDEAPSVVQPNVWAVVLHLPQDADPSVALDDFRARLPQFAGSSWMVSP